MNARDELVPTLKRLRLSGLLQSLELRKRQAIEDNLDHDEFLSRLLHDEIERRDSRQLIRRLKRADFQQHKTIEDFEFTFNPRIPKAKLIDLAACHFIAKKENVLLVGPTGVGKSHLAQAIGHRACRAGFEVTHVSAHAMLMQLRAARADSSVERKLLRFTEPKLLIIDDLGLRPLEGDEHLDLFEVIRRRYERGSILITSNRAIEEWYPLFKDALLASAAMDRLLHHAHIIEIEGHSYRNPPGGRTTTK